MKNDAERVLISKRVPSTRNTQWVIYFDGALIYGFNGKLIWSSYKRAYKAAINMLCQCQFVDDGVGDCFVRAFDKTADSKAYVDGLISSGRMEIREVTL